MKRHFHSWAIAAAALLALGGVTAFGGASAHAAPMCSGPDAPPACHGGTPVPPAPPATLDSPAILAATGNYNMFNVTITPNPSAATPKYAPTAVTGYRMSVSCTNGYFESGPIHAGWHNDFYWGAGAEIGQAAGTCYVSTWDQLDLNVSHVSVHRKAVDSTAAVVYWEIAFTA